MKIKAFVFYHKFEWSDTIRYSIDSGDLSEVCGPEYVKISHQEFEVDIPDDFDPRPIQIAALRAEKTKVMAEAEAKKQNIDEQISRLLAIENKAAA
jgi:hypothetical protein